MHFVTVVGLLGMSKPLFLTCPLIARDFTIEFMLIIYLLFHFFSSEAPHLSSASPQFSVDQPNFSVTVDTCIAKVQTRFESFQTISTRFGFIMPAQLNQLSDDELCSSATRFAKLHEDHVSQDVTGQFLSLRSCWQQAKGIKAPRD